MTPVPRSTRAPLLLHQALPSFSVSEWALAGGYDGVIVDLQHGEVGLDQACAMIRALPRGNAYGYARIGGIEPGAIMRLLDSGARGIVAPTVETAEQARRLVEFTKYPPLGNRSLGPSRPALYEGASYTVAGNDSVSTVAQIETTRGVENAEAIITTEGIDSIYVGPADLAVSYGLPGRADWRDGPVHEALVHLRTLTTKHGVTLGIYSGDAEHAAGLIAEGLVDYVGLGIDLVMIARATEQAARQVRGRQ